MPDGLRREELYTSCRRPLKLGNIWLKNRITLPAHSYCFALTKSGADRLVAYVRRRIEGHVALIVLGETEVGAESYGTSLFSKNMDQYWGQRCAQLRTVADEHKAIVIEQLFNPGGQVWFEEQRAAWAPSQVIQEQPYLLPQMMSVEQISELRESFRKAAATVTKYGMHGVELKADQGKLHHQFLSRRLNLRQDEYGGSFGNRMRFLCECLEDIRSVMPADSILGIRLPGAVTAPEGAPSTSDWAHDLTLAECTEITSVLSKRALVDYISISGETNSSVWGYQRNHGGEPESPITFRHLSRIIRGAANVPIILAGRISNIEQAEEVLASQDCDAVGMVRAFIADGDLLKKTLYETISAPVRPCISCNISCVGNTWFGREVRCIYDAVSGREAEFPRIRRKPRKLSVAVIGGGPAGMEFARVSSEHGASVSLFEKQTELGGALLGWRQLPNRQAIGDAISFWKSTIELAGIEIRLSHVIMDPEILASDYDLVAIASGGREEIPEIARDEGTVKNFTVMQALAVKTWPAGALVLVVDADRNSDPLGVAILLRERGAKVAVICPYDESGIGLDPFSRAMRLTRIREAGIEIRQYADVRVLEGGSVFVLDHATNRAEVMLGVTHVVWAVNRLSHRSPPEYGYSENIVVIGDADWPRGLDFAVKQAHDSAHHSLLSKKLSSYGRKRRTPPSRKFSEH